MKSKWSKRVCTLLLSAALTATSIPVTGTESIQSGSGLTESKALEETEFDEGRISEGAGFTQELSENENAPVLKDADSATGETKDLGTDLVDDTDPMIENHSNDEDLLDEDLFIEDDDQVGEVSDTDLYTSSEEDGILSENVELESEPVIERATELTHEDIEMMTEEMTESSVENSNDASTKIEGDYEFSEHTSSYSENVYSSIVKYLGKDRDVVVPDTLGGNPVSQICQHAFSENDIIETVTLPAHAEDLEEAAFYKLPNLKKISLQTLAEFEVNLFIVECPSFEELHLEKSVTFYHENSRERLPVVRYTVDEGNEKYTTDEHDALMNKEKTELCYYPVRKMDQKVQFVGLREVDSYAFSGNQYIEQVTLQGNPLKVDSVPFVNCASLKEIYLEGVTSSVDVFTEGLSAIERISVTGDGNTEVILNSESYEKNNPQKPEVIIGEGVSTILAFSKTNWTSTNRPVGDLVIGKDVTKILEGNKGKAIDCSGLFCAVTGDIQIDEGNTEFVSENNHIYSKDRRTYYGESIDSETTEAAIEDGVTRIGQGAFRYHGKISKVTIPDTVTSIGEGAFYNDLIVQVYIPPTVTQIESEILNNDGNVAVISGVEGSYAQTYAEENGYHFKAVDVANETVIEKPAGFDFWSGDIQEVPEQSGVYVINNAAEFAWVAKTVNEGTSDFMGKKVQLNADLDLGDAKWVPIGTEKKPFKGSFDGKGHTISHVRPAEGYGYTGLFGYIQSAVAGLSLRIEDVIISDFIAENTSQKNTCGVLAGAVNVNRGTDVVIEKITANGSITRFSNSAGIISELYCGKGCSSVLIENCNAVVDILTSGASGAGGIVRNIGYADSYEENRDGSGAVIKNCSYTGNMNNTKGRYASKGGILQNNEIKGHVEIIHCSASGSIDGCRSTNAGGIVVSASGDMTITSSVNKMDIRSGYSVGGIAGSVGGGAVIRECVNEGYVIDTEMMAENGGITGSNGGTIEDCVDYGTIPTAGYSGGIAGTNGATIQRCYDIGGVDVNQGAVSRSGAITAHNTGKLLYCYFDVSRVPSGKIYEYTNDESACATSTAQATAAMMEESTYVTWDFSQVWEFDPDYCYGYPVPMSVKDLLTQHPALPLDSGQGNKNNEARLKVVDQDGKAVREAAVSYGTGNDMVIASTNSKGYARVPYDAKLDRKGILVEKEGYISYEDTEFIMPETCSFTIRIVDKSKAENYVIGSCIMTYLGYRYEMMTEEITLNCEFTEEVEFQVHTLIPSADIKEYQIVQPDAEELAGTGGVIAAAVGGYFHIPVSYFVPTSKKLGILEGSCERPVYIRVIDDQGGVHDTKINLVIVKKKEIESTSCQIGNDMSFEVDSNIPYFGGSKINLKSIDLPISLTVSEDQWEFTLNLLDASWKHKQKGRKNSGKWDSEIKTIFQQFDSEDVNSLMTAYKKVKKNLRTPEKLIADNPQISVTVFGYGSGDIPSSFEAFSMKELTVKIYVVMEAKHAAEFQAWASPPIVLAYEVKGSFTAGGELVFDWSTKKLKNARMIIDPEFSMMAYAGTGAANVLSCGVYGRTTLGAKCMFFTGTKYDGLYQLYLLGEMGIGVRFLGGSALDIPICNSDEPIYIINRDVSNWKEGRDQRLDSDTPEAVSTEKSADLSAALKESSETLLSTYNREAYTSIEEGWTGETSNSMTLQSNAYPDLAPLLLQVQGKSAMVFLSDASDRDTTDKSALMYSLFDETQRTWSEPKPVWDDGTADFMPYVYSDGEYGYVVWNNAKGHILSDMTYQNAANQTEVAIARFTGSGFTEAVNITNNDVYESSPKVVISGGRPQVSYTVNSANDVWRTSGTNTVYLAQKNAAWESTILGTINGIIGQDVIGLLNGEVVYSYLTSKDGIYNPNGWQAFAMTAGGQSMQLAEQATDLCFGRLGESEALIMADKNGTLSYVSRLDNAFETVGSLGGVIRQTVYDPDSKDLAILYTRNGDDKANAYVKIFDAALGSWSEEIQLTSGADYVEGLSGTYVNGQLLITYNHRTVDLTNHNYIGTNALSWDYVSGSSHLAVSEIFLNPYEVIPGKELTCTIEICNEGNAPASSYHLTASLSEGTTVYDQTFNEVVSAGGVINREITFTVPQEFICQDLTVSVTDPTNEQVYTDNSKKERIGTENINIFAHKYCIGGTYSLGIEVQNDGYESASGTVEIYDLETRKVYDSFRYSALGHGKLVSFYSDLTAVDWTDRQELFLGVRLSGGAKVLGDHDRNVEIRLPHTVKVQGITLDQYTAELTEDAPTVQLHANILPAEAENHEISWYSQNESIATVTDDGLVTGIERGRTRIYAKSADTGVVRSCMVNVNFTPKAESMTVYNGDVSVSNVTGLNMKEGEVIALRAEILPEEAREHTVVTWHTADPNVAFVDNSGVLTAITAGSTSLVVNADNVEFSCKINVSEDTSVTRVTDVSNLHSEHDYASREEHTWLYTAAEKSLIVLTFDENTYTERNFDFLYICDGQNQQLGVYQGDMLSGATVLIYSTGFRIRLTSDSALNYYGFAVEDMKIFPAEELPATLTLDKTINCDVGDMIQTNELSGKMINLTGISEETHLIEKGPLKDTGSGYLVKGNGTAQTTTNLPDLMEITHLTRVNLKDEGNSNTVVVDDPSEIACRNYENILNASWIYASDKDTQYMLVSFSDDTKLRERCDYLILYSYKDGEWVETGGYTGTALAGKTVLIEGSMVEMTLHTDGSINENGFAVDKIISSDTTFTPTDISVKINQGVPVYEDSTFTLAVTDVKPTLYSNYILPVRYEPDSDADLTVLYDRMIGRFRSGKAGPQIVHVNVCGYSKAVTINVLPFKEDTDGGETGGETGGGSGSGGSNSGGSNSGGSNSGGSNSGGSSSGGSSGRGTVVSPKPLYIHVANIAITGISKKIAAGKKIQLTAIIAPENATNRGVIWSTSNPKIATVTAGGLVKVKNKTGKKSVVITATAADGSGKKADFKITSMKNPVKKVKISGKKTVKAGKSIKLKAKVTAKSGANKKLLWTSSNTAYAVVNSKGKIKTLKAGKGKTVTITAMATDGSGKKGKFKLKLK